MEETRSTSNILSSKKIAIVKCLHTINVKWKKGDARQSYLEVRRLQS